MTCNNYLISLVYTIKISVITVGFLKLCHESNKSWQGAVRLIMTLIITSEGSKSSTHYLSDKNRFDVLSKGPVFIA